VDITRPPLERERERERWQPNTIEKNSREIICYAAKLRSNQTSNSAADF